MTRNQTIQRTINLGKHFPNAVVANLKYGFPGKKLKVIGVTGTDGKTTTVNMIYQILKDQDKKVSMISTINAVIAGKVYDTGFHVTSPAASDIQKFLKMAVDAGDEYVVLEITSHALDQYRAWGVPIEIGVVTNITREHLDYHRTMEHYFQSKAKLIQNSKYAVLNKDNDYFGQLQKAASGKVIGVSSKDEKVKLQLPGEYNQQNALQALAVAKILEMDLTKAKKTLEQFRSLSGRMEEIPNKKGLKIIVDFAHTPNALEQVFQALKKETKGKLIVVFGAASQRDAGKRPMMGQAAARYADIIILTAEDPRFEDPSKIIDEIASGAVALGAKLNDSLYKEPDRQKAINLAVNLAKKGDIVGVFGKGHEKTMNSKGVEKPWSDQEAVRKALKNG